MVAGKRARARKQPAEVRREEVLEAAVRVFAATPYRSAGTAEIARAAGIAEPTIYRHFDSKRDLYLAAVDRTAGKITEEWRRIVARTPDAGEALEALGEWYVQGILTNPDLLRLRMRAKAEAEDEDVRESLRRGYGEIHDIVVEVIRRGQQQGVFNRDQDPEGAAWLFMGVGQILDLGVLTGLVLPGDQACTALTDSWMRVMEPATA